MLDNNRLPNWIHVVATTIPALKASLAYWKKNLASKTTQRMLEHHPQKSSHHFADMLNMSESYSKRINDSKARERQQMLDSFNMCSEDELAKLLANCMPRPCPGRTQPQQRAKWLEDAKESAMQQMSEMRANGGSAGHNNDLFAEGQWYHEFRSFVPPPSLRGRCYGSFWQVTQKATADENYRPSSGACVNPAEVCASLFPLL